MDVSADITELMRTPVAVVCAGAKSILDIPRTLEALETSGVSVATMRSDEFPAFYTRASGCRSPCRWASSQPRPRPGGGSGLGGTHVCAIVDAPLPAGSIPRRMPRG